MLNFIIAMQVPVMGCVKEHEDTKVSQRWASLLFIAYPALQWLHVVLSPPLPLLHSQIMIREDANGKEYTDYQL